MLTYLIEEPVLSGLLILSPQLYVSSYYHYHYKYHLYSLLLRDFITWCGNRLCTMKINFSGSLGIQYLDIYICIQLNVFNICWYSHIVGSSISILTTEIFYKIFSCSLFSIFLDMEYIILFHNLLNFHLLFLFLKLDFPFLG